MEFKKLRQNALWFTGQIVLSHAVDLLCKSLKVEKINNNIIEELESKNQNYVLAFWHGTMLIPWFLHRNRNFAALTSQSKDGDLLAKILNYWNYEVVRGSSHKGGETALNNMIELANKNKSVAITPDGPRGPEFVMKAGAVITSKKSGIPLVLAGVGYRKKRILKSWDKFQIPNFFSEAKIVYAGPFYIAQDLDYTGTNELIKQYGELLIQKQKEAELF